MGYWFVVVAEVAAVAAGLVVLNGPLHAPQTAVAWIALVVGVHFIALAVVWKLLFFHGLGAALPLCGVAGLVLAATGSAVSAIDLEGGVLPGAILLGFGLRGATRSADAPVARKPVSKEDDGRSAAVQSPHERVSSVQRESLGGRESDAGCQSSTGRGFGAP